MDDASDNRKKDPEEEKVLAEWRIPRSVLKRTGKKLFLANLWGTVRIAFVGFALLWGFVWVWNMVPDTRELNNQTLLVLGGLVVLGASIPSFPYLIMLFAKGDLKKMMEEGIRLPRSDKPDQIYPWYVFSAWKTTTDELCGDDAIPVILKLHDRNEIVEYQKEYNREHPDSQIAECQRDYWGDALALILPVQQFEAEIRPILENRVAYCEFDENENELSTGQTLAMKFVVLCWILLVMAGMAQLAWLRLGADFFMCSCLALFCLSIVCGPGTFFRRILLSFGRDDSAELKQSALQANAASGILLMACSVFVMAGFCVLKAINGF